MFALLTFETIPEPKWRQKFIECFRRQSRITVNIHRRWGLKTMQVHVVFTCRQTKQSRELLVRQALLHITEYDIMYVLLPKFCEYATLLNNYNMRQPDIRALLPSIAGKLLLFIAEQRGLNLDELNAAVIASRLNADSIAAVRLICRRIKSFALSGGIDTELMARQLRRNYGISVLERNQQAISRIDTDIYLLFDAPQFAEPLRLRPGNIVIEAGNGWCIDAINGVTHIDDARYEIPEEIIRDMPPGVSKQRVLALLVESGMYAVENLKVKSLLLRGEKIL